MTPAVLRDAMTKILGLNPHEIWPDQTKDAETRVRFRGDPLAFFLLSDDATQARIFKAANIGTHQS